MGRSRKRPYICSPCWSQHREFPFLLLADCCLRQGWTPRQGRLTFCSIWLHAPPPERYRDLHMSGQLQVLHGLITQRRGSWLDGIALSLLHWQRISGEPISGI